MVTLGRTSKTNGITKASKTKASLSGLNSKTVKRNSTGTLVIGVSGRIIPSVTEPLGFPEVKVFPNGNSLNSLNPTKPKKGTRLPKTK